MSALLELTRCASCGSGFEQSGIGRRRLVCTYCRPERFKKKPPPKRSSPTGKPFSVPHFAAWAKRLKLDSGELWVLDDFQVAFVADLFAGVPECWLIVPEGNGKSTLIAGLALYHIEFREDARVPVAAASRDQAGIIYRQAEGFVRRNKLEHVFNCQRGYKRIGCSRTRSTIQIHAADAGTADGEIFTLGLIDELHRQKLELYRTWNGKLDKRGGAQLIVISTAGEPGGEFETERELLRQTASEIDRQGCFTRAKLSMTVMHEWAVPEDGDVEDLELVASANPHGRITAKTLEAKRARIRHLGHWTRFTCNRATRSDAAAIGEPEWFAAVTDEGIPEGERVWLGLDLGWKYDTTAMVPLWVRDPEFRLLGAATILEPPRDGQTMLDPSLVEQALLRIHARNPIDVVVMDMTDGAQLAGWIQDELGCQVVDRTQSQAFAVMDYARFTEALRLGWLKHTGDPGLTRHVLNAQAKMLPGGDVRFVRPKEGRQSGFQDLRVIDALAAAAMVHTSAAADLAVDDESIYDTRDLVEV